MPFDQRPGERLSRFIFDSGQLRAAAPRIKHHAFMPPPTGRLSVYWTEGVGEEAVWAICAAHVTPLRTKPVLVRGDFNSLAVYAENLRVDVDGVPHERHANVVGWEMGSTKTRLQALKLAESAECVPAP